MQLSGGLMSTGRFLAGTSITAINAAFDGALAYGNYGDSALN